MIEMKKETISKLVLMELDNSEYEVDISEAPNWILIEKSKLKEVRKNEWIRNPTNRIVYNLSNHNNKWVYNLSLFGWEDFEILEFRFK